MESGPPVLTGPTGPALAYEATVPVVVRRAATEFGDADFVVMPDRRISFRDAERTSRRLAKELLAAGVGKGTRVGIHLPTGPEWAVAWLAVTRVGAIAMAFSTIYRPAELRTALQVGDVQLLWVAPSGSVQLTTTWKSCGPLGQARTTEVQLLPP